MFIGLVACSSQSTEPKDTSSGDSAQKKEIRFIMIPNVVHAWYDEVNKGAQKQAKLLSEQLGVKVTVDYRAPKNADVAEQNSVLEQAAATKPDGIALAPLDIEGNRAVVEEILRQGIPVVLFDAPPSMGLTTVGNDFGEQALYATKRMVEILDGKGKVAVMHGVPSAPNQAERYDTHINYLSQFPGIEIVDGGIDNDNVEDAKQQAAAVIAAHPDLDGYLSVNAAGPIGQCSAVEEADKVGQIHVVGMENLIEMLKYVKSGTMDSSASTIPQMQGTMSILMLWQNYLGVETPKFVDTGIAFVTKDNVDEWISIVESDE
jgi:ribose transport system substrate-binding protein